MKLPFGRPESGLFLPEGQIGLIVLGCFVLLAPAWSAEISVGSYAGSPGSSVPALLSFAAQGKPVSGIQVDLEYDSSVMSIVLVIADQGREAQKSIFTADLNSNRKRILIVLNRNLLSDGALVNIFANLKSDAPAGPYPLKLSRLVCSDAEGHDVPASVVDGRITISSASAQVIRIRQEGVLNAASLRPSSMVPGEVITLIGSGIGPTKPAQNQGSIFGTTLNGTRVLLNGFAAPLLYVSPDQINAVVPYALSGSAIAQLVIENQKDKRAELTLPVSAVEPAVFTLDSSGTGPGAILNEDYSINTPLNPAARGSVVSLFVTGTGQTDPPSTDAQIEDRITARTPLALLSVQIAETVAEVAFTGAAPGLISGVLQVKVRVPESVVPGYAILVVVKVGSMRSQNGVTLAVN